MSTAAKPQPKTLSQKLNEEVAQFLAAKFGTTEGMGAAADISGGGMPSGEDALEAIIIPDKLKRPALLVRNNTFESPQAATWRSILDPNRSKIEAGIRAVGRVEMTGHPTLPYAGTAWMITDKIAVTNRHVGSIFARKQGSSFVFRDSPMGGKFTARVDFREEFNNPVSAEIAVEKVLYIADDGDSNADVTLLQLKGTRLPAPISLFDGKVTAGQQVVVIGYPANDPRNPAAAVADIFGNVFEVKRLSPGEIMGKQTGFVINHDCSTLGGNSGAVVLDIQSGKAVGLHFGGSFRQTNFAVDAGELKRILGKLKVSVRVTKEVPTEKPAAKKPAPGGFEGRNGFDEAFLSTKAALKVALPGLSKDMTAELAHVKGTTDNILRYTHFSIQMSAQRRLAFYTAVNIDGSNSVNIRRTPDHWQFDPRVDAAQQVGPELYDNNDLDKGHLVRRLDPVWGDQAQQANNDTFVYANCTPQHARLNRGNWNDLEDYILNNTEAERMRVNVFTGPVFADDDPEYRGVRLPQAFWKVVSVVNGKTGKLHATGYMLSQKDLISNIEFVFGQFRTYQVPISEIERQTGLSFGKLENADPLKTKEGFAMRELTKLDEIVL